MISRTKPKILFLSHVNKKGPIHPVLKTRCWMWTAVRDIKGYGRFGRGGFTVFAHRFSYELFCGPITKPCVLHHCDNPSCVRPSHLWLGTRNQNMEDCRNKGRICQGVAHTKAHIFTVSRGPVHSAAITKAAHAVGNFGDKHSAAIKNGLKLAGQVGEHHHSTKILNYQVWDIRKKYKSGRYTQSELGVMFDVSSHCIWRVITGRDRFKNL